MDEVSTTTAGNAGAGAGVGAHCKWAQFLLLIQQCMKQAVEAKEQEFSK
jgi:hypothetical protein